MRSDLETYWRMSRPSHLLAITLVYFWGISLGLEQSARFAGQHDPVPYGKALIAYPLL